MIIALGFERLPRHAPPGFHRHARRSPAHSSARVAALHRRCRTSDGGARQVVYVGWDYANTGRRRRPALDPRRPAERLHGARGHRGLDADPPLLDRPTWSPTAGYARFFAYLNFFVFSMLLLVLAGNFLLLIVGWAFVGAASYLLISFWYRRKTATRAGIKAFVINVVGDVGLVLGHVLHLPRHRHAGLPRQRSSRSARSRRTTPTSSRAASCCSSARSRSPPRCRCTPGSPTPWRARPRSPP